MNVLNIVRGKYNPLIGGPAGYVSKLKLMNQSEQIKFTFLSPSQDSSSFFKLNFFFLKRFRSIVKKIFIHKVRHNFISNIEKCEFSIGEENILNDIFKNNHIDAIHCHRAEEIVMTVKFLNKNKINVKKYLTLHNPTRPSQELYSSILKLHGKSIADRWKIAFIKIENLAIEYADEYIFPCSEAIEGQMRIWPESLLNYQKKRISFVLTGTQRQTYKIESQDFRKMNMIPEDALVFCFVGRHNEVKGYDLLKDAALSILNENKDVYFLIAGEEFPYKGLKNKRWIEIGWTNDSGSIINASDFFILPNRETFFDLVLLEVLSLGKCALISNTGGNKKINEMSNGIITFQPEVNSLIDCVKQVIKYDKNTIKKFGLENRKLYDNNFTLDVFVSNYKKIFD